MNELPSSEFRKTFARLTEPTMVTVNGHRIGMWAPIQVLDEVMDRAKVRPESPFDPMAQLDIRRSFNSKPFTPAPKTKGK
jgi:hypothetical protein